MEIFTLPVTPRKRLHVCKVLTGYRYLFFGLRGRLAVREHVAELDPRTIAISVITLAELRYGAACSARPGDNHRVIDDFISVITILGLTPKVAGIFDDMKAALRKKGRLIEDMDLLIAATARVHDVTLVTNNVSHFQRVADLHLKNWVES